MNLFEQTEWTNWKRLNDTEKLKIFDKVLDRFVDKKIEITYITLTDFELCGIKCRTVELEMAGEVFIFIPGNQDAILGWDLGVEGLRTHELLNVNQINGIHNTFKTELTEEEMSIIFQAIDLDKQHDFLSLEEISFYINRHTSPLRKVKISPMIVQKYALPAGTEFLGIFDIVSGTLEGEVDQISLYEEKIKESLYPNLSGKDCFEWSFPETFLKENHFYLEFLPKSDHYFVYSHSEYTHRELKESLKQQGFSLLDSDHWEFMTGAGTRRLFRWGNEVRIQKNISGKNIQEKMTGANMFGVVIDTQKNRYELTNELEKPKLEKQMDGSKHLIEKKLPLSSYYQTNHSIDEKQKLKPEDYLYRKAIVITN